MPEQKLHSIFGTPYYIAPEILNKNYNEKCDLWSCGVVLYVLCCGYPPFRGKSMEELTAKIKSGAVLFDSKKWDLYSKDCKDLINKLLTIDPEQRISALEALEHPFIKNL
jgi:calcium-dependent protein kinase